MHVLKSHNAGIAIRVAYPLVNLANGHTQQLGPILTHG